MMEAMEAVGGVHPAGKTIALSRFGRHLIGRDVGALIRREFFTGDPATWPTALSFLDVEQATESCIDEIFGSLVQSYGIEPVGRVRIESAITSVRDTIEYVLSVLGEPPAVLNAKALVSVLATRHRRSPSRRTRRK